MHPCKGHGHHHHGRTGQGGPWGMPFGFTHGRGGFGPGGPRARRGDVQAAVLALLVEQDMHGYQVIQELSSRSGGAWSPSPGSVYPTLQLLEDQGLVTSRQEGGKKVFSLTDEGKAKAAEAGDSAPWEEFGGGASGSKAQLREAMFSLGAAVMQIGRNGTDEQAEQVAQILADARKRIYLMLAED